MKIRREATVAGITERGRTVAEARAKAEEEARRIIELGCETADFGMIGQHAYCIAPRNGCWEVQYKTGDGRTASWSACPDPKLSPRAVREQALSALRLHLAKNDQDPSVLVTDAERREYVAYEAWQERYRQAVAQGATADEAHRLACGNIVGGA